MKTDEVPPYMEISVPEFPYLRVQKGEIKQGVDIYEFQDLYNKRLREIYFQIKDFLPEECRSIMDVGSGLGGINAILNWHYGGNCKVTLLDGEETDPVCELHRKPFNSMKQAGHLLKRCGVKDFNYMTPEVNSPVECELIVSFGSWCFHIHPNDYLDVVRKSLLRRGTLIVDVRTQKPEYLELLKSKFHFVASFPDGHKITRCVFKVKQ